tara:strand:+ start:2333 stop:3391 length:1059 start_codon:yes stop_codon:yes gene_type:complete
MKAKNYRVLGLMSGTSLDGLDIAYCNFKKNNNKWEFEIICSEFIEYTTIWKKKLSNLFYETEKLEKVEIEYSEFLSNSINNFIKKKNITVDYISSHGHTIFHNPKQGITKQIGKGDIIFRRTKIPVVSNFREQDVRLGGEGAPLVPYGDVLLFGQYDSCLNLGGFSNISFTRNERITAFDISPLNIVLNFLSEKKGYPYDKNGINASRGKVDFNLLKKLNEIEYYRTMPPKSLSKEWLEDFFLCIVNNYKLPIDDLLRTCVEHFSIQISKVFLEFKIKNSLITGGGVFNEFLISKIEQKVKAKLIIPSKNIIMFKEALIFAFLGLLRMRNEINCLSEITGSSKNHSAGDIYC